MINKSVGLYINTEKSNDTFEHIRSHFKDCIDIVIFSDIPLVCKSNQYSTLPSFYMYFFNHPIVFLDTTYLNSMKAKMVSQDIYLLADGEIKKYEI